MYGDTEVMRKYAGRLREQSVDIRSRADQLVAQTENVRWTGRAADSMRERVRERATRLRDVAARHETAAESLEVHLHEVEDLKDAIAAKERRVALLVSEAESLLALSADADDAGTTRTAAPVERALVDFEPPPPGHKDWLAVSLPGT